MVHFDASMDTIKALHFLRGSDWELPTSPVDPNSQYRFGRDMPSGQQRISHPIASFSAQDGTWRKNAAQILIETGRKMSFSPILSAVAIPDDWMAVDAVVCEPFSVPNSLLTGKNTGKISPRLACLPVEAIV
jgi:hypothetical protein